MKTDADSPGEIVLRERTNRGLTQAELASRVGTNQQTVDKIEKGLIKHSRIFPKLAKEFGLSLEAFLPPEEPARPLNVAIPENDLRGEVKDLPVHTSVQGGQGEMIVSTDPVDWVLRPAPLAKVARGYGLIVVGESMEPEFEAGDIALIHPHLPPVGGATCVFYAERDGEARATIKRLLRVSERFWHVRQWNPPRGEKADFTLPRSEWAKCHRVVGKYSK